MDLTSSGFNQTVVSFHVEETLLQKTHVLPLGVLAFRIPGCQSMAKKSRSTHATVNRKGNEQKGIRIATHAVKKHCLQMTKERKNKLELDSQSLYLSKHSRPSTKMVLHLRICQFKENLK